MLRVRSLPPRPDPHRCRAVLRRGSERAGHRTRGTWGVPRRCAAIILRAVVCRPGGGIALSGSARRLVGSADADAFASSAARRALAHAGRKHPRAPVFRPAWRLAEQSRVLSGTRSGRSLTLASIRRSATPGAVLHAPGVRCSIPAGDHLPPQHRTSGTSSSDALSGTSRSGETWRRPLVGWSARPRRASSRRFAEPRCLGEACRINFSGGAATGALARRCQPVSPSARRALSALDEALARTWYRAPPCGGTRDSRDLLHAHCSGPLWPTHAVSMHAVAAVRAARGCLPPPPSRRVPELTRRQPLQRQPRRRRAHHIAESRSGVTALYLERCRESRSASAVSAARDPTRPPELLRRESPLTFAFGLHTLTMSPASRPCTRILGASRPYRSHLWPPTAVVGGTPAADPVWHARVRRHRIRPHSRRAPREYECMASAGVRRNGLLHNVGRAPRRMPIAYAQLRSREDAEPIAK